MTEWITYWGNNPEIREADKHWPEPEGMLDQRGMLLLAVEHIARLERRVAALEES